MRKRRGVPATSMVSSVAGAAGFLHPAEGEASLPAAVVVVVVDFDELLVSLAPPLLEQAASVAASSRAAIGSVRPGRIAASSHPSVRGSWRLRARVVTSPERALAPLPRNRAGSAAPSGDAVRRRHPGRRRLNERRAPQARWRGGKTSRPQHGADLRARESEQVGALLQPERLLAHDHGFGLALEPLEPSARTVVIHASSADSNARRASSHDVAFASGSLKRGSSSVVTVSIRPPGYDVHQVRPECGRELIAG